MIDIVLVDYGAGNLRSVAKGFRAVDAETRVAAAAHEIADARAIVIPGVGHFAATATLDDRWRDGLCAAIARGVPILGICVGLQWLFDGSVEAPAVPGFGAFAGRCFRLSGDVKVPHVGWSALARADDGSRLLAGIPSGAFAYFTHTYAAPAGPHTAATCVHGVPFAAAVERGAIFGVQFHPEKSGATGLRVLANFVRVVRERG
jgi:glutamine amidotransferase